MEKEKNKDEKKKEDKEVLSENTLEEINAGYAPRRWPPRESDH